MSKPVTRCAIYTRKSSEEGLEQSFNSLDAQRDACEAYISSQRHEGWIALKARYDDGGFSGGNMDRPALKRLLDDIGAGKVNLVIVYKVDRLTRSLMDFAKIIERFDSSNVSFVSVTQQFNTTTSMGRLTLNVLLSFAQFEREVTGERIRDKIAASKRKGMFMGGNVPIGYRVKNRKLEIHTEEARTVREIFEQYARLKTLSLVIEYFAERQRRNRKPLRLPTSAGSYYHVLSNRMYIGEIEHKGQSYPGQHKPIISAKLWDKVAATRSTNARRRSKRLVVTRLVRPLTGILYNEEGIRYTPTFTIKGGKRYYYYTSQAAIKDKGLNVISRIPAEPLEKLVETSVLKWLEQLDGIEQYASKADAAVLRRLTRTKAREWSELSNAAVWPSIREFVLNVIANAESLEVEISITGLFKLLDRPASLTVNSDAILTRIIEWDRSRRKGQLVIHQAPGTRSPDPALIKALARSRRWYDRIVAGEVGSLEVFAKEEGFTGCYAKRVFNCTLNAPQVVESILDQRSEGAHSFASLSSARGLIW